MPYFCRFDCKKPMSMLTGCQEKNWLMIPGLGVELLNPKVGANSVGHTVCTYSSGPNCHATRLSIYQKKKSTKHF